MPKPLDYRIHKRNLVVNRNQNRYPDFLILLLIMNKAQLLIGRKLSKLERTHQPQVVRAPQIVIIIKRKT